MKDKRAEEVVKIFKDAGMTIELGAHFSVKGQIAQLLNGSEALQAGCVKNEVTNWISVVEHLPDAGKKVLATFENSHGKRRTICGNYVPRWTIVSDCGEAYDEYNEEEDAYYLREGWYENIENWGDFSSVYVCEGEVTHWMPLPEAP